MCRPPELEKHYPGTREMLAGMGATGVELQEAIFITDTNEDSRSSVRNPPPHTVRLLARRFGLTLPTARAVAQLAGLRGAV
jgi:hypothetical protein